MKRIGNMPDRSLMRETYSQAPLKMSNGADARRHGLESKKPARRAGFAFVIARCAERTVAIQMDCFVVPRRGLLA